MDKKPRVQLGKTSKGDASHGLGYVVDPLYGKLRILEIGDAGDGHHAYLVKGKKFGPDWRESSELTSVHLTKDAKKSSAPDVGPVYEEFKIRIDHAIDREELEDIRRMILEESDLAFSEKQRLSSYLDTVYKKSPDLGKR